MTDTLSLQSEISELIDDLRSRKRMDGARVLAVLLAVQSHGFDGPVERLDLKDEGLYGPTTRKEGTPTRFIARNWDLTNCKRCGVKGAQDGTFVVRIFGIGWWHDACYRVVNPDYYVGM